ncbi:MULTISPECIES: energy-coupling factor ABC transporter ATP-binding protein [unclassified Synechocystis]|uniref:energy-coupling factor ABC transporter ATP-binding protein n=1 Tax=unclassified Synechocystis TaxID=2640012 RepID=UPI001872DE8A|nr:MULTISPECIES: ABC transporter ATP-binding protein [unclassified Synechocystis]MCT0252704.1 energy-coupling factor ABC transporter ATP-binding protein [Synechocystis sp. CS-94]
MSDGFRLNSGRIGDRHWFCGGGGELVILTNVRGMDRSLEEEGTKLPIPPAITVQALSFAYGGQEPVLNNLSWQIAPGERLGIIGHNGCGKTTLFLLLCGLLKPSAGTIKLLNNPLQAGKFLPEVGLLFQNPTDQLFATSVWDDIAFGPQNMGLSPAEVTERVNQAVRATGIAGLLDRLPQHLSGGEKQMVAIAGLLAMAPKILLCDEPTASLDIKARRQLINFLRQFRETLLISSHDLEFVLEVCDRVMVIDQGQMVADGPAREIMGNEILMESHGLEKPYSLR